MEFKCLTFVFVGDRRFEPGQTVTDDELKEGGQTDENIEELEQSGVISRDLNADVLPEHQPVEEPVVETTGEEDQSVVATDSGEGSASGA
jgi:hypothetical protein